MCDLPHLMSSILRYAKLIAHIRLHDYNQCNAYDDDDEDACDDDDDNDACDDDDDDNDDDACNDNDDDKNIQS